MKNILAWVKGHLAIVICSALIILTVPTAWFFSSQWNKKLREKQTSAATAKMSEVESSSRVTYRLPRLSTQDPAIEVTSAPNQTLTDWFKLHRQQILDQAKGIVQEAERINKRDHTPLVEGLFPSAVPGQEQVKALEMAEKIVYIPGNQNSAYPKLLQAINAGTPPEASNVGIVVAEEKSKLEEQITSGTKRELTAEEKERVEKATVERRLAEYQARAGEISVYGTMDMFPIGGRGLGSAVPRQMPAQPPALDECFMWQFDYWLAEDVLDAIALANTDEAGQPTSVDRSVVKRIEKIETSDQWVMAFNTGSPSPDGEAVAVDAGSPDALIEPKFEKSITGRWSGPGNAVYDVRNVALTVVVSSAKLPQLIDAFARTNFMTVTDLDLSEVDEWADLDAGYFYGSEHVVRAKLVVETIWLRSWTVPLMPTKVRSFLNIPEEPAPEGDSQADQAADPGENR
ncbi:MAG: hypothetical protein AMXMBFR58_12220 [Phycisphaerae bacterium]|nr:hypothetical protein [Phycisphaerales bacterium]